MYYQWKSPNYVFYASVSCEEKKRWTIHIGSVKRPACITIQVYKKDPEALLQNLSFDSMCASNKPMPRGIGTREMLSSALYFLQTNFKWVKRLAFTDYSRFHCDSISIPLSELSFFVHQKTWYERYFDAVPMQTSSYTALRNTYAQTEWNATQWPLLWNKYFRRFELPETDVQVLFQSHPKATDFFAKIYKDYGCRPFVGAFASNGHSFFKVLQTELSRLEGTEWWIPMTVEIPSWFHVVKIKNLPPMDWTPPVSHRPKWLGGENHMLIYASDQEFREDFTSSVPEFS
jgi:hypothetical protein